MPPPNEDDDGDDRFLKFLGEEIPEGIVRFHIDDAMGGAVFQSGRDGVLCEVSEVDGFFESRMYLVFPDEDSQNGHGQSTKRKLQMLLGIDAIRDIMKRAEGDREVVCVLLAKALTGLDFMGKIDENGWVNPTGDALS